MKTKSEVIENVENIKLSERTKQIFIALASFEESFWKVCELLTEKSSDEKVQDAFELAAEREQEKARGLHAESFKEMENLIKKKMFQTFFETRYEEI